MIHISTGFPNSNPTSFHLPHAWRESSRNYYYVITLIFGIVVVSLANFVEKRGTKHLPLSKPNIQPYFAVHLYILAWLMSIPLTVQLWICHETNRVKYESIGVIQMNEVLCHIPNRNAKLSLSIPFQ